MGSITEMTVCFFNSSVCVDTLDQGEICKQFNLQLEAASSPRIRTMVVMFSHSSESLDVSREPDIQKTVKKGSLELGVVFIQ